MLPAFGVLDLRRQVWRLLVLHLVINKKCNLKIKSCSSKYNIFGYISVLGENREIEEVA